MKALLALAITLVVAAVASAEPIRVSEDANDIITLSSDPELEDNIISEDQGVETVGHLTKRSPICKRSASPCIIKKSKKTLKKLKKLKKFKKFVVKPVKKFKKFVVKPKKLKKTIKKLPKLKKALPKVAKKALPKVAKLGVPIAAGAAGFGVGSVIGGGGGLGSIPIIGTIPGILAGIAPAAPFLTLSPSGQVNG